jgi:light-regulated signal transduction histidine kinase (bacteriophytochrome)
MEKTMSKSLKQSDGVPLEETLTLETADIEHLREENFASRAENVTLREAANLDQLAIGELERVVADLRSAQSQIEILNRSLRARNVALESVNKEMESFSYAVSHDLRSPLRSIHGFSDALRQSAGERLSVEECRWLQKISDAAARMDRLTEDLLRLSRITRLQLKREPVDLALVAREVVHELRQAEPHRDVVFAISDHLITLADPVLMRVAVTNLLQNAWKYTGQREQALISFGREQRDTQAVFCVRDNGAGFDMAYASKLFAPFQRLHSVREFPGSGVGLACVARVIHKHGGRIWADARTGEGAAFFFTIPGKGVSSDADANGQ